MRNRRPEANISSSQSQASACQAEGQMGGEAAEDATGNLHFIPILGIFASAMLKCSSASIKGFGEAPLTVNSHNKNVPLPGHPKHISVVFF